MNRTRIDCIVGARPNFVKMAPILNGLHSDAPHLEPRLVHTGQHYDQVMSGLFFDQLGLPRPNVHLGVGSGSHGQQTARVLAAYEELLLQDEPPVATLVVGDVNSTLACALAAVKLGIPVIHVEAGLRSFDRTMPEELNRVLTDAITDLLLVTEPSGTTNLRREGRPESAIRLVGNVMIDALESQLEAARALDQPQRFGLTPEGYSLWTLHRPSNVDDPARLSALVDHVARTADTLPVVWPVHPRTRQQLERHGLWGALEDHATIHAIEPQGYLEFLGLSSAARLIVTDSGGLQEEATVLGVPCLTLRANTERPITVDVGTNTLVGDDPAHLPPLIDDVLAGRYKAGQRPPLWDGQARLRVAHEVTTFLAGRGHHP